MSNIKIYWIYFPNEKLGEYIRNESNNENWPSAKKYLEINKDYFQQINQWKQAEENNKKVKEIIANIQKWFRVEGLAILDSKEPIRTYKIEDIRPLLKETNYSIFSYFYRRYYNRIDALIGGWGSPGAVQCPSVIEMPVELAIAYQKQKGEIPLGNWETQEGLAQHIKELEAKLKAKETELLDEENVVKSYRELANKYLEYWKEEEKQQNHIILVIFELEEEMEKKLFFIEKFLTKNLMKLIIISFIFMENEESLFFQK